MTDTSFSGSTGKEASTGGGGWMQTSGVQAAGMGEMGLRHFV